MAAISVEFKRAGEATYTEQAVLEGTTIMDFLKEVMQIQYSEVDHEIKRNDITLASSQLNRELMDGDQILLAAKKQTSGLN